VGSALFVTVVAVGFSLKAEAEPRAKLGTPTEQSPLLQVLKEHEYKSNYCMYLE
jgi:hypothetical protein